MVWLKNFIGEKLGMKNFREKEKGWKQKEEMGSTNRKSSHHFTYRSSFTSACSSAAPLNTFVLFLQND